MNDRINQIDIITQYIDLCKNNRSILMYTWEIWVVVEKYEGNYENVIPPGQDREKNRQKYKQII